MTAVSLRCNRRVTFSACLPWRGSLLSQITLQLDDALIERLRTTAQTRGCSMAALIATLLHEFLPSATSVHAPDAIGLTATPWNQEEAAFLHEAMRALDEVPSDSALSAQTTSGWDEPGTLLGTIAEDD